MVGCNKNTGKSVTIKWCIENFQFCWHKTGERLESPLFNVDFISGTFWRLWLYPRGEDDGEYLSFYLFREEGGPEVIDVDFELFLIVTESFYESPGENLNWYSFKIHQREGLKYFASRWEVFAPKEAQNETFVVRLGCRILNRERDGFGDSVQVLVTRIGKERICGTEIFDDVTDRDPHSNKDIEVKSMLEDEPLININLSYVKESLVIKIRPVSCKKIKYAICKITVIKNGGKESPIKHVRSWIGGIKADIWRYCVLLPETESLKPDLKTDKALTDKTFFVHYDFAFSTGEMAAICGLEECVRYIKTLNVSFDQYWDINIKTAKSALDSLVESYRSRSFVDVNVKTKTKTFPAHKAILCARSPKFRSIIEANIREVKFPYFGDSNNFEDLFLFLYTDTVGIPSLKPALKLHKLSFSINLEPLKTYCRNILTAHLNSVSAVAMLRFACFYRDIPLKTTVENYIAKHYELVISSTNWEVFADKPEFRKEVIFMKYKKQKAIP
ncbi:hypothetical protein AVEN_202413-1 [Araneus ventricosus]|uniref:Uncharacterized protein n=1 Tax=Araneus ventricosus TaxID=182803 RepID=A0A4Y2N8A1_ARAVE|nr:hypothetical protein AVEN_202413-1 [Araneus ventricosus]